MSYLNSSRLSPPELLKHILLSEILSITSAMRKNSRWASSTIGMTIRDSPALGTNMGLRISSPAHHTRLTGRGSKEAELLAGFIELRRGVKEMNGLFCSLLTMAMGLALLHNQIFVALSYLISLLHSLPYYARRFLRDQLLLPRFPPYIVSSYLD